MSGSVQRPMLLQVKGEIALKTHVFTFSSENCIMLRFQHSKKIG